MHHKGLDLLDSINSNCVWPKTYSDPTKHCPDQGDKIHLLTALTHSRGGSRNCERGLLILRRERNNRSVSPLRNEAFLDLDFIQHHVTKIYLGRKELLIVQESKLCIPLFNQSISHHALKCWSWEAQTSSGKAFSLPVELEC